jgi:imidazolonepropionase-like amidohydrolase
MKIFKYSMIALSLACTATAVNAERLAITNATLHTATAQGVLKNATVVIENGKIAAINPASISADKTFDANGKILTPGLIGSMNQLGLVEVGAVASSRDAGAKKADIDFDPSTAFNPMSSLIPYARKGGITSSVIAPRGGDSMFKGQTFVANLSGEFDSVLQPAHNVLVELGSQRKGSRAFELQQLSNKFEDAEKKLAKAEKAKQDNKAKDKKDQDKKVDEVKRDEKIINALLSGEKTLLVYADRASDLLELIKLKKRFGLDLVIIGAADAVVVAKQLAQAKVPVVIEAMENLPRNFDSMHASLSNAATLTAVGVKVVLAGSSSHNLYQLRYDAGNAVANGMTPQDALAAVTANVAEVFHLNAGSIAVGKNADLVLWSGDPFELSTKVDQMWINGEAVTTRSRQDALRERYLSKSDMPKAYVK